MMYRGTVRNDDIIFGRLENVDGDTVFFYVDEDRLRDLLNGQPGDPVNVGGRETTLGEVMDRIEVYRKERRAI